MRVVRPTKEQLRKRRARLLAALGVSREVLEERAMRGLLTAEEYWTWEEIRSVEFLLLDEVDPGPAAAAG